MENGLHKHKDEVVEIRKQMNTLNNLNEPESQIHENNNKLDQHEMLKESVINADMTYRGDGREQCSINTNIIPKPDIQVSFTVCCG